MIVSIDTLYTCGCQFAKIRLWSSVQFVALHVSVSFSCCCLLAVQDNSEPAYHAPGWLKQLSGLLPRLCLH